MFPAFHPKWLVQLSEHLRPEKSQVRALEIVRCNHNIDHESFTRLVIAARTSAVRAVEFSMRQARLQMPHASRKFLLRTALEFRATSPPPEGLGMSEEEVDSALEGIHSVEELVDYIAARDQAKLTEEMEGAGFPLDKVLQIVREVEGVLSGSESVESAQKAQPYKGDDPQALFNRGVKCFKMGAYDQALKLFKEVIKLAPDHAEAHYSIGVACGKLGRYEEALAAYEKAISIEPDFAMAYNNLSVVYGMLNRWDEAVEACRNAVRIDPEYAEAHSGLAVALLATGNRSAALEEYVYLKEIDTKLANELLNVIKRWR